ncbi:PIN domain-containing protein [Rhodoferax sp. BLA1]|uniref:PIN domain-containing protein n=1 Tax=Rhodoferax sp. BLA1 TaxID=2576062 RepID=UPI0015D3A3CC|nr:PIN domain-containing protein [Rhodoferax sp. BLA1]
MYVLDTNVISNLHKNYYRKRFVSLWKEFDLLVANGKITSTREAFHELHDGVAGADTDWAKANAKIFTTPDAKEGAFVGQIYSMAHFQANIEKQKLYKGGRNADSFIVARAYAIGGTVVTMERLKPNAVKVPNICEHFKIPYLDLEGFMEKEGWVF